MAVNAAVSSEPIEEVIALNIGAGDAPTPEQLKRPGLREIRIDAAPPADIIADIRAIPLPDEYAMIAYASHCIEHVQEHEVVPMLREWRRLLKPGGVLIVRCPNIRQVAHIIVEQGVDAVMFESSGAGYPIRAQDALHGFQLAIQRGHVLYRHLVAFDRWKLEGVLREAGFARIEIYELTEIVELLAAGERPHEEAK